MIPLDWRSALTREERPNLVRSTGIAMAELGTLNGSGKLVTKRTWILRVLLSPLSSSFIIVFFCEMEF